MTLPELMARCAGMFVDCCRGYALLFDFVVSRNLSKVIHRKDLPRIYTMCLPNKLGMCYCAEIDSCSV